MDNKIVDIRITNLKIFPLKEGDVLHGIKNEDENLKRFGEVYFSKINFIKNLVNILIIL